MPARRGGDDELRVANIHQCLFAQLIGIALASLGKGDDFLGDDRDDGVRPIRQPKRCEGRLEGDTHGPLRLRIEMDAVQVGL
jgi:hypothetical protein